MSKISKMMTPPSKASVLTEPTDEGAKLVKPMLVFFGLVCLLFTVCFNQLNTVNSIPIMIVGLAVVVGLFIFMKVTGKMSVENFIILLFVAGIVIRLGYVLYTPLTESSRVRQHDVYAFGSGKGHSGYIEHFYENGFKLADFNPTTVSQFYHPPLHHFLAALWMRVLTLFGMSYERAITSLQFLALFYSCCCMLVSERIFRTFNLKGAGLCTALAVVVFHPTMILLSGSINNDQLALLFTLLAVYTTVKWYNDSTTKNILLVALSIGLGMMTKLSVALVAPPVAIVFLIKLIQANKKKIVDYIGQYCVFGVVCIPLGMWFAIRNFIKYQVPLTYVAKLSDTSDQYLGNYSVAERLFGFSNHPFENVFLNRIATGADFYEYNPFVATLKSSIFGEYKFSDTNEAITPFCRILLILNFVVIAVSLCAMIYMLIKKNSIIEKNMKIFIAAFYLLLFGNFINFCFKYPHNCSMDFRYIVPTMIIGAMFIGMLVQYAYENKKDVKLKLTYFTALGSSAVFSVFSIIVYIMLGIKT